MASPFKWVLSALALATSLAIAPGPVTSATLPWTQAPGNLRLGVQIPNSRYGTADQQPEDLPYHRVKVDVFEPLGTNHYACCFLHGGGGAAPSIEHSLGLAPRVYTLDNPLTAAEVKWNPLDGNNVVWIVPWSTHCTKNPPNELGYGGQFNPGQAATYGGPPIMAPAETESSQHPTGIGTWSGNHVMYSQSDTVQFLHDLSQWIIAQYGNVGRILAGHSNGGMMAQATWKEGHRNDWNAFYSFCGEASGYYIGNPVTPPYPKSMREQYGYLDTTTGLSSDGTSGDHVYDPIVYQDPGHYSFADEIQNTHWIGPWVHFQEKVDIYNAAMGWDPETVVRVPDGIQCIQEDLGGDRGFRLTWTCCRGNLQLVFYTKATHKMASQQKTAGSPAIRDIMAFARSVTGN